MYNQKEYHFMDCSFGGCYADVFVAFGYFRKRAGAVIAKRRLVIIETSL